MYKEKLLQEARDKHLIKLLLTLNEDPDKSFRDIINGLVRNAYDVGFDNAVQTMFYNKDKIIDIEELEK